MLCRQPGGTHDVFRSVKLSDSFFGSEVFGPGVLGLRARGLCCALLLLLVAGCESMSQDLAGPATTDPSNTQANAAKPGGDSDAALSDLAPLADGTDDQGGSSLKKPEIFRGSGVLARRPGGSVAVDVVSGGDVTLNFANADIREVINVVLGQTLGVNYIIDPKVQGQVTARTSNPIPRDAVIPALENILSLNGAALTLDEGIYKIVTLQQAAAGLSSPMVAPLRGNARGFGIYVVPIEYASAAAIADLLKPFVAPGRILRVDSPRNLLIFAGTGPEAGDLIDMVSVFDVDWMSGMSFALFPVQVADAKSLVTDLESVFTQGGDSPVAGVIRFVPIERLNAVLAISPRAAYLDRVETWIDRLDRGAEGAGRRIFVYHVQNGRAVDLSDVLGRIFETDQSRTRRDDSVDLAPGLTPISLGDTPEPLAAIPGAVGTGTGSAGEAPATANQDGTPRQTQNTPRSSRRERLAAEGVRNSRSNNQNAIETVGDSGNIRIIADEVNNALVVLATSAEFRMIEATLKRLDITPLQVLIEVTIAEVTLNDDLRYGLQWFFQEGNNSFSLSNLASGAASSAFPGFSYAFASTDAQVVLNLLAEVTDVQVVSSPQLMVLDNQSARLQVGDQVPIATQSSVSVTDPDAPVVNSIQFRDTGVILEVTPRVNAGGLVVLDVLQEVSDVIATTTSDIDSPTIQQRSIESTVAVQSGDSIAIGGLIRDKLTNGTSGIPVISEIPLLGNLFKTTTEITQRTELLVLITPRVVRDQREAREVTDELRKRLSTLGPLEKKIFPDQE